MTREYWLAKTTVARGKCLQWAGGDLALTKRQEYELWDELSYWCEQCPHEEQIIGSITSDWEDEYGSRHRSYYDVIQCKDCGYYFCKEPSPNDHPSYKVVQAVPNLYSSICKETSKIEKSWRKN